MALTSPASSAASLADTDLIGRIAARDESAFEALMRRYNGRLFRVARAILRDDGAAEDALQDAYLDAYRHAGDFGGRAPLSTWLTRIVINHSLMRLRKQKRDRVVIPFVTWRAGDAQTTEIDVADEKTEPPSNAALRGEIRRILEQRIDDLPVAFRTVLIMRDVEDMTVQETAEALGIPPATVRTRLFRARAAAPGARARHGRRGGQRLRVRRRALRSHRRADAGARAGDLEGGQELTQRAQRSRGRTPESLCRPQAGSTKARPHSSDRPLAFACSA
jgi:RNA polymerase sigma-70 factor (ECF subfamily)